MAFNDYNMASSPLFPVNGRDMESVDINLLAQQGGSGTVNGVVVRQDGTPVTGVARTVSNRGKHGS